jgi:hypothetical protein
MLQGIIFREKLISASSTTTMAADYEDTGGFYFRCKGAGDVAYVPINNAVSEVVIATFEATESWKDAAPVYCRNILKTGTTATGIYAGEEE